MKLKLSRETIRELSVGEMRRVMGGGTETYECPSVPSIVGNTCRVQSVTCYTFTCKVPSWNSCIT